jgi:hypothetical protein
MHYSLLYLGFYDFFGFRKNTIHIENNGTPHDFELFYCENSQDKWIKKCKNIYRSIQGDTMLSYEDWYGTDCIRVKYNDSFIDTHGFKNWKIRSWEKITYKLYCKDSVLHWTLSTLWQKKEGTIYIK